MSKLQIVGLFVLTGFALGTSLSLLVPSSSKPQGIEWLDQPRSLPAIKLIASQGDITGSDFEGRLSLILFGFTHCPDVCPTGLARMANLMVSLDKRNPDSAVQMVFVSVDPDRDDVTRINEYVAAFGANIFGFTGDTTNLDALTEALGSFYKVSKDDEDYQVGHSVMISVIGPDKNLIGRLRPGYDETYVARQLVEYWYSKG